MVNVAIYVRLSDEDRDKALKTDESESIQNQKSMLKEYCKDRDWDIYDIYDDEDYSGTDSNRPEFNRMISDCERGNIDIVLCKSQSRFSRDAILIETYLHNKFLEWGVRFIGVVDHADTNDKSNKKSRQILALTNEWYVEEVSENIRRTLKHKREQGQFTGSFAPYGYKRDPQDKHHLIIDEAVAPVVRDIFNWYVQGWGYRKIVLELNNRGIPNPSTYKEMTDSNFYNGNQKTGHAKSLWTQSTIYTIIHNEVYSGTLVQSKSHSISYKNQKRKNVPKEEWIRVFNTHEAIIPSDTWQKVKMRLNSRARVSKTSYELSVLSGKVKCAVCGAPMKRQVYYNKAKTIQYYNLQCGTYKIGTMTCPNVRCINGRSLESSIVKQLNEYIKTLANRDEIQIRDETEKNLQKCQKELEILHRQLHEKETRAERLYEDKLDGIVSKEQFILFNKKNNEEIENIKTKIDNINREIEYYKSNNTSDRIEELLEKYTHIEKLTKTIVDEFIRVVRIGEYIEGQEREVIIEWNF